jgi:predicted PurR-regulated permease PerM
MTAHTGTPAGRTATVRYELTNRSLLLAVAAVASIWLLAKIWGAVLILVGALILVGTLNPYVVALQGRGLGRISAAATVFLGVLSVLGLTLVLVVPPLLTQLSDLSTEGPTVQSRLAEQLASRPSTRVFAEPVRRFYLDQGGGGFPRWPRTDPEQEGGHRRPRRPKHARHP